MNYGTIRINNFTLGFSYTTLVTIETETDIFTTSKKFSPTTSKHIKKILDGRKAIAIPQDALEEMVSVECCA